VGRFVQNNSQLRVDLIALRQSVIQVHIAHHGAHARDRQLYDATDQVVHLIDGFHGIGNLPVDNRINMNGDVVASDDRLRRQVNVLFAQIDGSHARARVGPINRAWAVHERYQNIQPAAGDFIETAETFDQHDSRLRQNADGLYCDHEQYDGDETKKQEGDDSGKGIHKRTPEFKWLGSGQTMQATISDRLRVRQTFVRLVNFPCDDSLQSKSSSLLRLCRRM